MDCFVASLLAMTGPHVHRLQKFQTRENLFPETAPLTSRNSAQRRRSLLPQSTSVAVAPSSPAEVRRLPQSIGRRSMSKRIAFLSATPFGALALTAAVVAPVSPHNTMMNNDISRHNPAHA